MLGRGFPIVEVVELTGLSEEEVRELQGQP
jgi:hypothetical protein